MAINDPARVEYLRSLSNTRLRFTSDSVGNEKRSEDNMPHIADSYARILELVGEDPSRQALEKYYYSSVILEKHEIKTTHFEKFVILFHGKSTYSFSKNFRQINSMFFSKLA